MGVQLPICWYRKNTKTSDSQKLCCNHPEILTRLLYHRVLCPEDADGMGDSVDPDQEQSDLGLHCLLRSVCQKTWDHVNNHLRSIAHSSQSVRATVFIFDIPYEPCQEKTCLRGLRPGKTNWPAQLQRLARVSWNFGFRKFRYHTTQAANNKGADQTAQMRRLICAFVVRIILWQKQVFWWRGSYSSHRLKAVSSLLPT